MLGKYLVAGSLAISLVTAAGWYVTKGHLDSVRSDLAHSAAALEQANKTLDLERATAVRLADSEKIHLEALTNAENQIDSLRADVESGRAKLRIKATCPAVPKDATAEPGNDAAAPELTADARQAYWDLRRDHERVTAQILMLQDYARECYGR